MNDTNTATLEDVLSSGQLGLPPVLDACCGSRMFWFDRKDQRANEVNKQYLADCLAHPDPEDQVLCIATVHEIEED